MAEILIAFGANGVFVNSEEMRAMIMRQVRMVENKGRANEPRIVSVIIFALLMTAGLMAPLASLSAGEVFMGTVAGTGTSGFSGDAGFAMGGKLAAPEGVAQINRSNWDDHDHCWHGYGFIDWGRRSSGSSDAVFSGESCSDQFWLVVYF